MAATVLYMSMSLDGFIAGPNAGPGNGLGDDGERLHEWVFEGGDSDQRGIPGRPAGVNGQVWDEFMSTGAVVAGRGTFEPAGGWGGDHHDGVPIFVLTRQEPDSDTGEWPLVSYVGDVDLEAIRGSGTVNGQIVEEFLATGAVVAGRGTFEPAGGWGGDHHDGVPIFVLARHEPGIDISQWPLVTYVNDVTAVMTQAKEAAGDSNVLVHGAGTAQLALAAGVLDELELHVIPVLFGQGRRLFEGLAPEQIELERTRILKGEAGVTHLHYRVRR